jgi:hypothetical protein
MTEPDITTTPDASAAARDGRADFDFLFGTWRVVARRAKDMLDAAPAEWHEFEMTQSAQPILGGLGNVDTCETDSGPDGEPFQGVTMRLFDPRERAWRIWWASSRNPGHLDPPLTGRFDDGVGTFHGHDVVDGREVDVRFIWRTTGPGTPTWEQAFSLDGGQSWFTNFTMAFHRSGQVADGD